MEATLAERGQVVIPKAIRDQLGLTPGALLTFTVEGGKLVIRKKVDDGISRARGIMKLPPGEDLDQWWREIRGRAPNDPIEPWEELRDDIEIPAHIREDHAHRRAKWLAEQAQVAKKTGATPKLDLVETTQSVNARPVANSSQLAAAALSPVSTGSSTPKKVGLPTTVSTRTAVRKR